MNAPQITARGLLTILAIAAFIGTLGFIDNQNREIKKLQTACQGGEMNSLDPSNFRFYGDSRHAFGVRFQVEKPSRDWAWFAGSIVVLVIAAAVIVWLKSS